MQDFGHETRIEPGEEYILTTIFPGHDSGYADTAGHPVSFVECLGCARDRGAI